MALTNQDKLDEIAKQHSLDKIASPLVKTIDSFTSIDITETHTTHYIGFKYYENMPPIVPADSPDEIIIRK